MIFYLLQNDVSYFKEDNPIAGMAVLIGIGGIVLIALLVNLLKNGLNLGSRKGGGAAQRRFSTFALHRAAKPYGLNHDQIKVLEYVFKSGGVTDPAHTLSLPAVLDKHFKRAYKQIEKSANTEEEAQQRLALLFSVRSAIDMVQNTTAQAPTTQQLSANQAAVLTANQESYSVKVLSVKGDGILVDCPRNAIGSLIRFPRGTRVTLAFFTKTNKGFSFNSQVLGVTDTSFGPALQLSHSGRPKAMTQRRFRRRQSVLACGYYFVRIEEAKNKKSGPRMTVEAKRYTGSVVDISAGGCAIKTSISVPVGARLKIEFEYFRSVLPVAALGQVLRTNRGGIGSTIMHIKFLKVPRKTMNAINTIVFEYGEE
ncbi:MAG: PilZ domain-containing protein [Treponema sp.]|jgi:c-di-GMP-binding flagellar brake protein YcgR|nr:PilZ domain-containing protein [Treponema sp.]